MSEGPESLRVLHGKHRILDHAAYIGLDIVFVCSAIATLFLQRYFELRFLAAHGYGVIPGLSNIAFFSGVLILIDAWLVKGSLSSKRIDKMLMLLVPVLFLLMGVWMILSSLDVELIP